MKHTYLIVGGSTRAGTTSLFTYLSAHPQLCAATIKETRFFLDSGYGLRRYATESTPEYYDDFFRCCEEKPVRLEATPDYLYSRGTAALIKKTLHDVRLVFILREPISRLVSWFRFAKQDGSLHQKTTLDQYVAMQLEAARASHNLPQHLRSLEQGRYSVYLEEYYRHFDRERIKIVCYEDLKTAPLVLVREICSFVGVDVSFYTESFKFDIYNESYEVKRPAMQRLAQTVNYQLLARLHGHAALLSTVRALYRPVGRLLFRPNRLQAQPVDMSAEVRQILNDYYDAEPAALARLLQQPVWEWKS